MIIAEAKNIKKDVILYGEGWHMGTNLPEEKKSSTLNADKIPGMAFFNDTFRDLVKGATFGNEAGYISGNLEYKNQVEFVMSGSIFNDKFDTPLQSINYVECHDNQTLYDKLFTISGDKEVVLRELKLANAITIFSLGIPFIHMGQEIGLSKFSLDNTYNVKNVNNMDWNLVEERKDLVNYTADLIKLRKKLTIFKMNNEEEISDTLDFFQLENGLLNITIRNKKYLLGHKKALIIINPTHENRNVEFDDYFSILFGTAGLEDKKIKIKHYLSSGTSFILFVLD